ncbi:hypothetical protein NDU88_010037 [Pleurodeles waltl]|uniref:Uncharacterized protein n=1 Tax=Pleurodeles waltl TaxID=8319 RepID=A0AAV7S2R6_PLEWA|nr:hypothetical protein NDU88_010037 [Pleurodeles waltl]
MRPPAESQPAGNKAGHRCSFAEPDFATQLFSSRPPAESQPAGNKVSGASPLSPLVPRGRSVDHPGPGPPTRQGRSAVWLQSNPVLRCPVRSRARSAPGPPRQGSAQSPTKAGRCSQKGAGEALQLSGSPQCRQSPGAPITPCCQALLT